MVFPQKEYGVIPTVKQWESRQKAFDKAVDKYGIMYVTAAAQCWIDATDERHKSKEREKEHEARKLAFELLAFSPNLTTEQKANIYLNNFMEQQNADN